MFSSKAKYFSEVKERIRLTIASDGCFYPAFASTSYSLLKECLQKATGGIRTRKLLKVFRRLYRCATTMILAAIQFDLSVAQMTDVPVSCSSMIEFFIQTMTGRVLIRRYRGADDDAGIRRIVDAGTMSTVFSFFLSMATREFVSQAVLMMSAVLFIVVGNYLQQ